MAWLLIGIGIAVPAAFAIFDQASYGTAMAAGAAGIVLYLLNIALISHYIRRRAPDTLRNDTWESTAGRGIVPKWVSVVGLLGMGSMIGGVFVAISIGLDLL